jgi:ABC-type multidrug transport system fused ATPase/permease subunit
MGLDTPLIPTEEIPYKNGKFPSMSVWSFFTFSWVTPLMKTGYRRPLDESDIFTLPTPDRCEPLTIRLEHHFEVTSPSLFRALAREWLGSTIRAGLWKTLNDGSQFAGPMLTSLILKNLTSFSPENLLLLALAMYVSQIVGALGEAQYFQTGMRVGMQLRTALIGMIFRKSLRLSAQSRTFGVNQGKLTNMIASDTESLQSFCEVMHVLWSAPLRIVTSLVLLYYLLGLAAVFGAAILLAMIPIQNRLVSKMTAQVRKAQQFTDERLKLVTEAFEGIQVVKCYTWESAFRARLEKIRQKELSQLMGYAVIRSVNSFVISAIPVVVAVVSFAAYSWRSPEPLTAVQAFTALSLFQILRFPLMQLPSVINSLGACRVSLDRITQFLLLEEKIGEKKSGNTRINIGGNSKISLKKAVFQWPSSKFKFRSSGDFEISPGDLIVVVGHTASGKSSFLQAILGHLPLVSGEAEFPSDIAYCPQNPWIFSGSIKNNVSFNAEFVDELALRKALSVCQFDRDLELMPDGVNTELGERGVNLSGGQKHRLSLARAVYAVLTQSPNTVVLLDDPLSALDASVANKVFSDAIVDAMKNRTRILVTNRLEAVMRNGLKPKFVLVSDGEIKAVGEFEELNRTSEEFRRLVQAVGSRVQTPTLESETPVDAENITQNGVPEQKKISAQQIRAKEERRTGAIATTTLTLYANAMRYFYTIVLLYVMVELSRVGASVWLSHWSSNPSQETTKFFLIVYVSISCLQLVFSLISQLISAYAGQQAARELHAKMFERLLIAPMKFFQSTPLGRILNRFAKDVGDVDKNVAPMMGMTLSVFMGLFSTLGILAGTAYYTVPVLIPLLFGFYYLQGYYRASSREIKRMDAISRSPIYAHFQQIQQGMDTVLAFKKQKNVITESEKIVDNHIRFNLAQMSTNRWLGIRLEFYGGALVLVTAVFIVCARDYMSAGIAGLALSTALQVTGALGGIVRLGAMMENALNSVERIAEYGSVDSEKILGMNPPRNWPFNGSIGYNNVYASYGQTTVLKALSFNIAGGQKVGVVGRTGAGKTSLVMTLFRILEIDSGAITIDGVNIGELSMESLRRAIGIIPQDPIVFEGTVRNNIDPFDRYSDEGVAAALAAAHLGSLSLDLQLVPGGKNLSAGQRQQVCLARVLLRRPKILVLDEATSSLDSVTDSLVLSTIRSEFASSTVITIAHRLHTVADSDLIIGLDQGKLVEAGSPKSLLEKPDGLFASLVNETGAASLKLLRERILNSVN